MTLFIPDVSRNTSGNVIVNMVPVLGCERWRGELEVFTDSPVSSYWSELRRPLAHYHGGMWHVYDRSGRTMTLDEWMAWADDHLATRDVLNMETKSVPSFGSGPSKEQYHHRGEGHKRKPSKRTAKENLDVAIMNMLPTGFTFDKEWARARCILAGGHDESVNGRLTYLERDGYLQKDAETGTYTVLKPLPPGVKVVRRKKDGTPHGHIPTENEVRKKFEKAEKVLGTEAVVRALERYSPDGLESLRRDDRVAFVADLKKLRADARF